jgi:hypothetical protein
MARASLSRPYWQPGTRGPCVYRDKQFRLGIGTMSACAEGGVWRCDIDIPGAGHRPGTATGAD